MGALVPAKELKDIVTYTVLLKEELRPFPKVALLFIFYKCLLFILFGNLTDFIIIIFCILANIIYLFNFYFYFVLLYNTVLVLPYIDMNPPWVYMSSQS